MRIALRTIGRRFAECFLTVCAVGGSSLWAQSKSAVISSSEPVELAEIEVHLVKHDTDGVVALLKQRGLSDSIPAGYPEGTLPDLGATETTLEAIRSARIVHPASSTGAAMRLLNEEVEIRARLLDDPRNGALHQVLGWIYLKEGRISEAVSECSEAVTLQPKSPSAHFQLGLAFLDQKRTKQADTELREAIRLWPTPFIYYRVLWQSALQAGRLKEAEREFLREEKFSADDTFPSEMLAEIYVKRGDFNSAIQKYREILKRHPNDVEVKQKLDDALTQSALPRAAGASTNSRTVRKLYDPALLHPSTLQLRAPDTFYVQFMTTQGGFLMTVNRAWAPMGVDRFYNLVKSHFYDDMALYRVVPNFVVQFGISSDPAVSKAWETATLKDEPMTKGNKRGYVAFAAAGPNTRTTEIFINLKENPNLDKSFAPFAVLGQEDMKVVDTFYHGYRDISGQDQRKFMEQGKAYSDKTWPKLDRIIKATIIDISP